MQLIRKGLLLLALFLALYVGAFAVLVHVEVGGVPLIYRLSRHLVWKGGGTWQRFQEYDPAVSHDVVVLGSSQAYRGYDPRLFAERGLDMFNLGTSAQTMAQTDLLMDEYLEAGNTGLLIVEMSLSGLAGDGLESTADLTQNVDRDRAAWKAGLALRDPRGCNMLLLRTLMKPHAAMYTDSTYQGRGYCQQPGTFDGRFDFGRNGTYVAADEQLRHLRALIGRCRERNVPLVLVNHPMPMATDPSMQAAYARTVRSITEGHGVPFIDLGLGHDLDNSHFADHSHLSQKGVERFVPRLIDTLGTLGLLPRP